MKNNILCLAMMMLTIMCSCGQKETKQELFNGKNLDGWTCVLDESSTLPTTDVYGVKDGNICGRYHPLAHPLSHISI